MAYHVRILTTSDKVIPYSEINNQGKSIKLVSGTVASWERIEIYETENKLISILVRRSISDGNFSETELSQLKESVQKSYPVSAREWLKEYFFRVKTIYIFQLFGDRITKDGWPVLGRIQSLIEDTLNGIIQADNEGFYNENGDYILWQMYKEATGIVPAATLDAKNRWITFKLNLSDVKAVECFKKGMPPQRGLLSRLLRM